LPVAEGFDARKGELLKRRLTIEIGNRKQNTDGVVSESTTQVSGLAFRGPKKN
jgi:hypothetical protein